MPILLLLAILLLAGQSRAEAQTADDFEVVFTADREEITVGDPVTFTLEVTYPSGYQPILPRLPEQWGRFEVQNQSPSLTRANGDGTETITRLIEATLFATGSFQTPELEVSLGDPEGDLKVVFVPPVPLMVAPVLAADDTELRDIRPQADLPVPSRWPWVLAGLLLLGLLGAAVYLLLRRLWPERVGAAPVVVTRSPYRIVQDELARISRLDLLGQSLFKQHYTLVADALRRYLEGEYRMSALDRTTGEVQMALADGPIEEAGSREVILFLSVCDLVKFTQLSPELDMARRSTAEARKLVELIRPAPEPGPMPAGLGPSTASAS